MAMVSYIRDQLIKVFSPNQADVLAHVVVEAHDALDRLHARRGA